MLAGSKETHVARERRERPGDGGGARPVVPDAPAVAAGSRDAAGLADALASMEKRLARMQARLDELDADVERQRIMKGAAELVGKEPGADPENLTNREKTILVKQISEAQSVSVKSLLPVVGLAHSTYHYRLNAKPLIINNRPDLTGSFVFTSVLHHHLKGGSTIG